MNDEFAGQGGSYLIDPKTGKRTLIERTKDQPEAPATADAEASKPAPSRKVKE
jgi:hypothetical protein